MTLRGTRDREIAIELSEEDLRRNNLSFRQVSNAVRRASVNLTFGELRTEAGGVILHTVAKRRVGEDFEDIPVISRLDGTIVTLGDVAEIRDGFVDEDILSEVNGNPTVFVRIDAAERQSIVDIADQIRTLLAGYDAPQDIVVDIWNDRAQPALDRLSEIARNGVMGAILVFVCLVLVFDLRIATWITVGIPLSFVGALIFFAPAGMTLNMGTLFGFFLLIGIVVDDAVVVGESIAAERERGLNALDAAVSGARAMVGPITIGVCTTILGFLPFLFVTVGSYQIVGVFPYVAIFVLLVSLVEAFFILPSHLSHERRWSLSPLREIQHRVRAEIDRLRDGIVVPAVSWSVRHIVLTLALGVLVVFAALLLVRSEVVRVIMFDEDTNAADHVQANLHLPIGTPFEATVSAAEQFVDAARAINDQLEGTSIRSISVIVGNIASSRLLREERPNASHLASVKLHLNERPVRTATVAEIERAWRRNAGVTLVSGEGRISDHTTSGEAERGLCVEARRYGPC